MLPDAEYRIGDVAHDGEDVQQTAVTVGDSHQPDFIAYLACAVYAPHLALLFRDPVEVDKL